MERAHSDGRDASAVGPRSRSRKAYGRRHGQAVADGEPAGEFAARATNRLRSGPPQPGEKGGAPWVEGDLGFGEAEKGLGQRCPGFVDRLLRAEQDRKSTRLNSSHV